MVTFEIINLATSDWARGRGKVPVVNQVKVATGRVRAGDIDYCHRLLSGKVRYGLVKLQLQVLPESKDIFPGTAKVDLCLHSH